MIAAKIGIQVEEVPLTDINCELVFGKVHLVNNHPYYVGCFYNSDGCEDDFKQLDKALEQVGSLCKNNTNAGMAANAIRCNITLDFLNSPQITQNAIFLKKN